MNPHDVMETGDCSVTCRCGETIVGTSLEDARRRHDAHFGLAQARTALEGAKHG